MVATLALQIDVKLFWLPCLVLVKNLIFCSLVVSDQSKSMAYKPRQLPEDFFITGMGTFARGIL